VRSPLALLGPGLLVAATGVGAGDLATAAFTGDKLGLTVLWAVVLGALFKYIVNEGLARWQLVTGETILEATMTRFGRIAQLFFGLYLALWSYFVGVALMSACGVVLHTALPLFADAGEGKLVYGALCSVLGIVLVWRGGFALFEQVMKVCIALMFVTVVLTAALLLEDYGAFARGLLVPQIPAAGGQGLGWTVALVGGVGGTLTILCYSYWIREEKRDRVQDLRLCRIDLGVGYAVTALFGIAMVVIGSAVPIDAKGSQLIVNLASALRSELGGWSYYVFLIGAFGAVFSSLLGVWQGVPSIFADYWQRVTGRTANRPGRLNAYTAWLLVIGIVPMLGLQRDFREAQKIYAIVGALFVPLLAIALWVLSTRKSAMGAKRTGWLGQLGLASVVAAFAWFAVRRLS
jgi:Mn2+/Fe2+ NRAMP family transporter